MRSTPPQTTKAMTQRRAGGPVSSFPDDRVSDAVPVSHRNRALRPKSGSAPLATPSHAPTPDHRGCTGFICPMIDSGGYPNAYLQAGLARKRMGEQAASLQVRRMLP